MTSHVVRLCMLTALALPAAAVSVQAWVARAWQAGERAILVTVLDQAGAPIRDLTAADFFVREDNLAREVTGVRLATEPLFIALLVDTTKPPPGMLAPTQELRTALATFVKTVHAASPDAQIALVEFAGAAVMTVNFTSKTADLDRSIRRLFPGDRQEGVLLEAIVDASKSLAKKPSPRRVIVSVNFGSPETSNIPPQNVAEQVQKSGASYWAVSVRGTSNVMAPTREVILNNLPAATGGLHLTAVTVSALESMLKSIADNLTCQYVVTYMRPDATPVKNIQVGSKRGAKTLMAPWAK